MRFFTAAVASIVLLAAPVLGAPTPLRQIEKFNGATTGKYIVKFKDGVSKEPVVSQLGSAVTNDWDSSLLNGFAGNLDANALNTLRASPDVEYISEDGIMHIFTTQTDAPWGLARLSQDGKLGSQNAGALSFRYTYDDSAGEGVDIYIVDTGVFTAHSQFGGRAKWGATFGGYPDADGNGHGTHCAGTAAGSQFGVAKAANIIAVKVLNDEGSGSVADIVSGLNFVISSARSSGRPSVASMSLGGDASTALDNAVTSVAKAGIHVTVAAGNSNANAGNTSPARAPMANTIGATTIADARASFSNFGAVVDLFAPGQSIISAWIGSATATNIISGTSMATPHVAGLTAYLIGLNGNSSPVQMSSTLKSLSVRGVISSIPAGTLNALANNS